MNNNNHPIIIINNFQTIYIDNSLKPFIICDIDNTIICSVLEYNYYYNKLKNQYTEIQLLKKAILDILNIDISVGHVKHTDLIGFVKMVNQIKQLGGNMIFLTSRGHTSHKKTIQDLKTAGVQQPEQFEIHYTNNEISKGEYIKNNLQFELKYYKQIIFIDDQKINIESVTQTHPQIRCYLYQIY